jgi:hypothetical protein
VSRIYSASSTIAGGSGIAAPICDLESSAVESPSILAIDFSIVPAVANTMTFGMGRASNAPVSSFGIPFLAENPIDPASTSILAIAWSKAPTVPANYHRLFSYVNSPAQYNIYTFPAGFKVLPSSSFVVWVVGTAGRAANLNVSWEIGL